MSQRMNKFNLMGGNLDPTNPEALGPQMIYVDNKMVLENEISMEDLMRMAD